VGTRAQVLAINGSPGTDLRVSQIACTEDTPAMFPVRQLRPTPLVDSNQPPVYCCHKTPARSVDSCLMTKSRGFTLIELMVVIGIVAILSTIAAPSFKWMIQKTTIASNVNTFLSDMRYARSESIRRGGGVVLCRSDDPEAAVPTCGTSASPGGNGWVSGWIIFHDLNDDGNIDTGEPLLRVQAPITSINSIVGSGTSTILRFTATGRFPNPNGTTTMRFGGDGVFDKKVQRIVCVSLSGRARIAGDGNTVCPTE
jgi:type IV fimbrial biogenesis protein FimT